MDKKIFDLVEFIYKEDSAEENEEEEEPLNTTVDSDKKKSMIDGMMNGLGGALG
jgi:hypothetical protein